jgi:hypothetical protein
MNTKVLDLGIVIVENAIENPDNIINLIESLNDKKIDLGLNGCWSPWKDENREAFCYEFRLNREQDIPPQDIFYNEEIQISSIIDQTVEIAIEEYFKIYPFAKANLKGKERPNVLKYLPGGMLPEHQDLGISSRALSILLYLNDNYEGGEINFPQSNISIKPKAGSVIFFPSNFIYVHSVSEIKSGIRYAVPAWVHNRSDIILSDGSE